MGTNHFHDPLVIPDEKNISELLGGNYSFYESMLNRISRECPDFEGSWKYYNDVKSWLFRTTRKKKTVFWMSVVEDAFRVTFYFNAKNEHVVNESPLIPAELKKTFRESGAGKKYKAMTVEVRSNGDVDTVMTLAGLKLRCK
ncbi:MAG TPA: DUF3788 family protein [Spirochaetota bacterium]|nr:DUF3788 family protein [Spirochaetota bacterium]